MRLTRVVLALGAVAVSLWLAGNLRSAVRADDASVAMARAVTGGVRPAELADAHRLFRGARRFGTDTQLLVNEAGILAIARVPLAAPLLREAVRREPENAEAWVLVYAISKGRRDPAGARARRRVLELDPRAGSLLGRVDAAR